MKNRAKLSSLLLALRLTLGVMLSPVGTAHAQATVNSEAADSSVVLGNTSGTDDQAPVAAETAAGTAAKDTVVAAPAEAEPAKDPREAYRDLVLQTPDELPAGTTAASRRYRKVDLSTYRAMMQNNAAQPAQ